MNSKSKKAITSLNKHSEVLDAITNVQEGNTWKASLKDTVNLYIGNDSSISQRLDKLYFTKKEHSTVDGFIGVFTDNVYEESKKQNFKNLIAAAITHIELNGVCKNPNKSNLLQSFGNTEIISGAAFIILLSFGIGHYFGKKDNDKESLRIEQRLKDFEKENHILKQKNQALFMIEKNMKKKVKLVPKDSVKEKK